MVCIGPGPGPKNVLAEYEDGRRVVVPYAIWKHQLSKENPIADKVYRSVIGAVQFPPQDKEAAGKPVRSIVVRQVGFKEQAVNIYATVWPGFDDIEIEKGDILFLEGRYTQGKGKTDDGTPRVYHNLSVTRLAKLGTAVEGDRPDVENATDADEPADDDIPF